MRVDLHIHVEDSAIERVLDRIAIALENLTQETHTMAINVADLTAAVTGLQGAAGRIGTAVAGASTALDDIAAKLAAVPTDDPTVQAAIDAATKGINDQTTVLDTASTALNTVAAKDDPAAVATTAKAV